MRFLVALALLGACGSGPDCKDAVVRAAKRFGTSDAPEVATLIGECEQHAWSKQLRDCFVDAKTGKQLEDCLPALDVKIPHPTIASTQHTRELVAKAPEPIRALLFYSNDNEVEAVLVDYFKGLPKLAVELHDRMLDAELAAKYKVTRDEIVLVRDDRSMTIEVDADIDRAEKHGQLRGLDAEVARAVTRLSRAQRRAYLVTGHGELTDPATVPKAIQGTQPARKATMLTKRLAELSFEVKPLGATELATDVPADATVVLVLAPSLELAPAESAALERYLDRGGALLVAFDPTAPANLDAVQHKLGVGFDRGHLTDDKAFLPQRGSAADHRIVITSQFGAHASVTSLARTAGKGLVLLDAGTLTQLPGATTKVVFTIKSMDSSFVDRNDNFALDSNEQRAHYNVAAAVEGARFRALVFADVDLFADALVNNTGHASVIMISGPLLDDSLRWLASDETFEPDPVAPPAPPADTKARLAAELELVERRLVRERAHAISVTDPAARANSASQLRTLEAERTRLRERVDDAH